MKPIPNLVEVVVPPVARAFTYLVPSELEAHIDVGSSVSVPFGKRNAIGYVVSKPSFDSFRATDGFDLKEVHSTPFTYPFFLSEQLEFFRWISHYYQEPLSNVVDTALPQPAPPKFHRTAELVNSEQSQREIETLKGNLQKQIVSLLQQFDGKCSLTEITKRFPSAHASLRALCTRGIVMIQDREIVDQHIASAPAPDWTKKHVKLNQHQKLAMDSILPQALSGEFHVSCLHGVTGSGKTEVYLEIVKELVDANYGALIIVPEIALTPQLIDRFRARLGNGIAILHSGLSKRARWDSWRALLEGRNQIAIGARSAIFAPVRNLRLIVVDEEHDSSYKQSEGFRYHARDLAVMRGKLAGAPVILGSATPSLETFYHARTGKYSLLRLPNRHQTGSALGLKVIDLNLLRPWEMKSPNVSPLLYEAIRNALMKKEQVFILYNRRGFASYLQCEKCEGVVECPNCSVTLTFHQSVNSLRCHYCGLQLVKSEFCNACSGVSSSERNTEGTLVARGAGTERIFDEVAELFPDACIDRLDRDTANSAKDYRKILDRVRDGQTDILIGTQMIAKGHDLPKVTVVGVIDCDVGLHMPDFRAGERVFQLLTQVAGRAGRGESKGHVFLQTRVPKHPSLVQTCEQDFEAFALSELRARKAKDYPPFSRLLRIVVRSQDRELALETISHISRVCRHWVEGDKLEMHVLGPAPAPLERLKTEWRYHTLIKSKSVKQLVAIMGRFKEGLKVNKRVRISYDLDPQDML